MRIKHILLFSATLALSACATQLPVTAQAPAKKSSKLIDIPMLPVSIECFAHPGVGYIYDFYIKERRSQEPTATLG